MKRPEKEDYQTKAFHHFDMEKYAEDLNKYIDYMESKNMNRTLLIDRLQGQLFGMLQAHKLITEFENSAIDHYAREVDLLWQRIIKLKSETR